MVADFWALAVGIEWTGLQLQRWQQVVIQLDPLDTGAEAFALTAPCVAPVMLELVTGD